VGFLWAARAITSVAGVDERWMRAPSLVAGIALLPLVWLLVRRLATDRVAAAAVVLVAVAPGLVRYSTEFKQYSLDAMIAVGLVVLAERVERTRRPVDLAVLAGVGAAAAWCSHPAVLVLAGIGLALLVRPARERSIAGVARLAPVGAAWAVSLGLLWWVSLRDLTSNEFLTGYWRSGFPDSLAPHRFVGWLWASTVALLGEHGGQPVPGLAAVAVLVGFGVALARDGARAALLLAPVPALVLAASLEQYPFRGRLALFALPLLLAGAASLADPGRRRPVGALGLVAVVLLAAGPAWRSAREAVDPTPFPASRPVLEAVAERIRPGDAVYVHGLADAPFAVYGEALGLEAAGRTGWLPLDRCAEAASPFDGVSGAVWVVFAYTHSSAPPNEGAILRSHLEVMGLQTDLVQAHDAFAARYDLRVPSPGPPAVLDSPTTGCLQVSPAAR
jgi:hypothetical protein